MVASIIGPILIYLERFLIGSLLPMSSVAYYSAPYEAVTRLWVIPASLSMTLVPVFSILEGIKDKEKLRTLFARSLKYVLLVMGSIIILVEVFAEGILQIWLGADFVTRSTSVLQILGLGVLINSFAQTPFAFLQGIGRPDIPAKFSLFELPVYIAIVCFFISQWGITGAAAAWTVRVTLAALLLFGATFELYRLSLRLLSIDGVILTGFTILLLIATAYVLKSLLGFLSIFAQLTPLLALVGLFAWFTWVKGMDAVECCG
ncbi:MAG TPA: polysaccharide biosynthesis C-terminal domain-containing protein [Candidatus Atribacteria bacterium]|nr:polysaccharide biosynthesis C-terminal domain-containing protein [Candidatus Atribacteria bacterium]HQE49992.1 polysaccharide biosynthesis C-terminal domain-containing protein [Fervidobacterium sp.]